MDTLLNKYYEFLLNVNPPKWWLFLRYILHWLTLPLKLVGIGALGIFLILKQFFKKNTTKPLPSLETKKRYFKEVLERLPIWETENYSVYVNEVPYYSIPDGTNHNIDYQLSLHSIFVFLMEKLGLNNTKYIAGIQNHLQNKWLCRGYKRNAYDGELIFNASTTSSNTLASLNLAMLNIPIDECDILKEKYDTMVCQILQNDYSLLEGSTPLKDELGHELYSSLLKKAGGLHQNVEMKSGLAMFQPGLEIFGSDALVILATLKIAAKRLGNRDAQKAYNKLIWKYGYGLLGLFSSAWEHFNDDSKALTSLYVLSKLSNNKVAKFFWKIAMIYTWALSRSEYDGYFTGLVNDAYPGTISQKYIDKCVARLYSYEPKTFKEINNEKTKAGIGFLASTVLLERNPKSLLE